MSKILDYSFARPDPATIKENGFVGVMRYLSPNAGKNLTASERDSLRAAGLSIGLVWEWYANRAKEGKAAGLADGQAAMNQANALGFPQYLPIYFAVDFDASEADQGPINDYFAGVRQAMAGRKVGVYGGYWPLKRLFDAQLVQYGWQTYAWSGGNWDPRAQLRQTLNGQWSGQVDFGETTSDDNGMWPADAKPGDISPPVATPAPNGSHDYTIKSGDTFWGLEEQNGWTHGTLQNMNPTAVATQLKVGQTIKVPGAAGTGNPISAAPSGGEHTIVAGDTFWGLEAANGWQHGTLQGLNPGVVATQLKIGQVIKTPGNGASPAHPSQAKYTIKSGDTFWGLETAHGWGHGTLQSMNPGQDPAKLQIGQQINIPG